MDFDIENTVVKLCADGMEAEGKGEPLEAKRLFSKAWDQASNEFEKFIAAHYLARTVEQVTDKLMWDKTALNSAERVTDTDMRPHYPSLHLNIAKCYEDLKLPDLAREHYLLARSFTEFLGKDGYGRMIKSGIDNGFTRVTGSGPQRMG